MPYSSKPFFQVRDSCFFMERRKAKKAGGLAHAFVPNLARTLVVGPVHSIRLNFVHFLKAQRGDSVLKREQANRVQRCLAMTESVKLQYMLITIHNRLRRLR